MSFRMIHGYFFPLCLFTLKNHERQSIMAALMILLPIEEHGGKIPGKEAVQ